MKRKLSENNILINNNNNVVNEDYPYKKINRNKLYPLEDINDLKETINYIENNELKRSYPFEYNKRNIRRKINSNENFYPQKSSLDIILHPDVQKSIFYFNF